MKKYWPVFAVMGLALGACTPNIPISSTKTKNNQTYTVSYLFEHDGCKVYRFFDNGNPVYFTNCNGEAIEKTDSTETRNAIHVTPK
jgi:hypothetical protein